MAERFLRISLPGKQYVEITLQQNSVRNDKARRLHYSSLLDI